MKFLTIHVLCKWTLYIYIGQTQLSYPCALAEYNSSNLARSKTKIGKTLFIHFKPEFTSRIGYSEMTLVMTAEQIYKL